jgi:hypothetical protein
MASETTAPAQPPDTPSEDEYQTFCAALSASARGRAFLAEYARRHRGADTETLLAALARLEALMRARPGADPAQPELRKLLASIRAARPELDQSALPARAAKLAVLLDLLERRLEALAAAAPVGASAAEAGRLAAVPPLEEPELPIPTPAAARPALIVAHERTPPPLPAGATAKPAGSAAIIPEVNWFDSTAPVAAAAEFASAAPAVPDAEPLRSERANEAAAGAAYSLPPCGGGLGRGVTREGDAAPSITTPTPDPSPQGGGEPAVLAAASDPSSAPQRPPAQEHGAPPDPLAVLMALSEEERIALFT